MMTNDEIADLRDDLQEWLTEKYPACIGMNYEETNPCATLTATYSVIEISIDNYTLWNSEVDHEEELDLELLKIKWSEIVKSLAAPFA